MEDALYKFLGLYKKSPPWIKQTVGRCYGLLPYRVRYGDNYSRYGKLAQSARFWSVQQHEEFQYKKARDLLIHAYSNVPYYRKKYDQAGITPDDFRTIHDLKCFPPLTREEIKQNRSEMLATNIDESKRLYTSTSGSSGVPLELFHQKDITRSKERAFLQDIFGEFGFKKGDKTVVFRGEVINSNDPWYFDPVDRNLIMSSYLLSEDTVTEYVDKIHKFKPSAIRGYPFMVHKLVQLMKQHSLKPINLKCVILESENIYDVHREEISEFLNCPVCHYYGHTERLVFGGNCRNSNEYHMNPEYGIVEIADAKGHPVNENCEGEIIATGFDNYVMPMIRYKTQDFAIKGSSNCACGRQFPLLRKIIGREEEYVVLNDTTRIPFHNLLAGIHGDTWGKVFKLQCVQERPGELVINIVPNNDIDPHDVVNTYINEIEKRVDRTKLQLMMVIVNDIPSIRSGKTKLFIRNINRDHVRN